jgi:hypothetical protein
MPSEFALEVERRRFNNSGPRGQSIAELVDESLQEVREVLDGLRWQTEAAPCWCRVRVNRIHDDPCQRARALYQRLRVDGKENDGNS